MKGLIITWAGSEALRSLTQNRSISLLPIANRSLLEHQVALLSGCGIRELIVVTKRGAEEELGPILDRWEGLSYRFFTPVADNLLAGLDPGTDSTLVVLLGPLVTDLELARALAFHRGREARATLILHTVRQHPRRSLVLTDQRGRVTRVLPRVPAGGGMARTAGGLYILEPDLLSYLAGILVTGKEEEICPHLLGAGIPVYGFPVDEYWLQVEDPAAYLQVHRDILHGRTRLKPEGTELSPGVWCGNGVKVAPDVRLVPPVILGGRGGAEGRGQGWRLGTGGGDLCGCRDRGFRIGTPGKLLPGEGSPGQGNNHGGGHHRGRGGRFAPRNSPCPPECYQPG
ncbi:MAG: nucleotidyltransferase family protein [bacterium]